MLEFYMKAITFSDSAEYKDVKICQKNLKSLARAIDKKSAFEIEKVY